MNATLALRGKKWSIMADHGKRWNEVGQRWKRDLRCIATGEHDEAEAEKKRIAYLHAHNEGVAVDKSKLLMGDHMVRWAQRYANAGKGVESTTASYTRVAKRVQGSWLGAMRLQDVTASHLEDYIAELLKDKKVSTARVHMVPINRALKKAKRDLLVVSNVASEVEDRPSAPDKGHDARVHCWNSDEARKAIAAADTLGPMWAALFALALDTGARKQELAGLQWNNFDFKAGTVSIEHQKNPNWRRHKRDKSVQQMFKPTTKSKKARTVTLAQPTVERVLALKRHQAEQRMARRTTYKEHGLLFADSDGWPIPGGHIDDAQRAIIRAAGVKPIKFHGLRHTNITLLLLAGTPIHVVSARAGHAKPSITLDIYSHVLDTLLPMPSPAGAVLYG